MSESLLSVCLITYNHAKYIREAIDSVLSQKANFALQLVIADDCSTDGTRELLLDYQKRYPDLIHLIVREKNVGAAKNWIELISYPQSKYIAYLEGDDYWTDPYKLQKQVDFLDANPEYSMCFHNAKVIFEENEYPPVYFNGADQKEILYFDDLANHWQIASASIVYKRSLLALPDWIESVNNGDLAMHFLLIEGGPFKYIDNVMCVYRRHNQGKSHTSNMSQLNNVHNLLKLSKIINEHYQFKYQVSINKFEVHLNGLLKKAEIKANFPFVYKSRNYIKEFLLSIGNKL
ncbi:glycosyltransferase [Mucilaginibacter flavidus]|uniref:glycosyltransferase n=1 Tax=Mucilaginibacter flavidus TaxID=2949309 RepID=UPI0020938CE4|nr:glycosyltransferase [Mucilaginibacter flavidus]MCO5947240.1 glycosyltransferase [Mucilaginibacter flavidus]